jgi:hypothetical protein
MDDFKDLIKDERIERLKTSKSPDSPDLVHMDDDLKPQRTQSPESPPGFKLHRSNSPIFANTYNAVGGEHHNSNSAVAKQRYSSSGAMHNLNLQPNRFSCNSIFNTSGLG